MAEIEATLYNYLTGHAGLKSLVGSRIYPMQLPQNVMLPALTYQRISGPRVHGVGGRPILARPRIQIDSWATSYANAKVLSAEVRAALDGHRAAEDAWGCILDNEIDDYDAETGRYRVIIDVIITHPA